MTSDTEKEELEEVHTRIDHHLEKALEGSENEDVKYHIREALNLLHL